MKFQLQTLTDYSDEALIAELRRVADSMAGERLTRARYDELARAHSTTQANRFGSWAAALDRAGISETIAPRPKLISREDVLRAIREYVDENSGASPTENEITQRLGSYRGAIIRRFGKWEGLLTEVGVAPVPLGRRYTDDECLENILVLWTHYGRQPSFGELKLPPSTVGPKAYIRRWGGWRAALFAFVARVNEPDAEPFVVDAKPISAGEPIEEPVRPPRSLSISLRYKILSRDKFRCVACGASPAKDGTVELHVDHIVPWSRGGQNVEENLRTLCFKCNLGKGASLERA